MLNWYEIDGYFQWYTIWNWWHMCKSNNDFTFSHRLVLNTAFSKISYKTQKDNKTIRTATASCYITSTRKGMHQMEWAVNKPLDPFGLHDLDGSINSFVSQKPNNSACRWSHELNISVSRILSTICERACCSAAAYQGVILVTELVWQAELLLVIIFINADAYYQNVLY